ncbi:MAG: hypothetical protein FWH41_07135 [Treponema sp.]|nr:hypothetical protein [Treponema sp.]
MALFLRLNFSMYNSYCPLYIAGKGICIFTAISWVFFAGYNTINETLIIGTVYVLTPGILIFLVLGEILSAGTVYLIMKSGKHMEVE